MTTPKADVDLYSDAGVKNEHGAWGCVAVRLDGSGKLFEASGEMRDMLDSSEVCEARAAANALHAALADGIIARGDRVTIRLDNMAVVKRMRGYKFKRKPKPDLRNALSKIKSIRKVNKLTLFFRHVKGHAKVNDQHSRYNRRCDILCSNILGSSRSSTQRAGASRSQIENMARSKTKIQRIGALDETVSKLTGVSQ